MWENIYIFLILSQCSCETITSRISLVTEYQTLQQTDHAGVPVSTASILQCAIECANLLSCNSLSYHIIKGICLLYPAVVSYNPFGFVGEDDWKLYHLIRDLPKDCLELLQAGNTRSGVYDIYVTGTDATPVWCDMETDGGGWTVFQRRIDGATDFYRRWDEYRDGFGDVNHEFWLGNGILHNLTSSGPCELRVNMDDFENNTAYANYAGFAIGSEEDVYRLQVSGYSGNAGDSLRRHSGKQFSTKDHGNTGCATRFEGAWWYFRCHDSNLNGLYLSGSTSIYAKGMVWQTWRGNYYSVKSTKMMIRKLTNK